MKLSTIMALARRRIIQEGREALYLRAHVDVSRPLMIRALPTERCNYKCSSCDCWRRQAYPPELTLEEWIRTLKDFRQFVGPCSVQFAGGEPFIFKPLLPLVEWCAGHGIDWGVITNGSCLSEATAKRVTSARPLNVDVSVDGATAQTHDASRGTPGSFERITRGIGALRDARDRAGESFPIRIKPTVHRHNFREMPALVEWAVGAGATSIDFSPVRPWTDEVTSDLWMRPEDETLLENVVRELIEAKRAGAPIETEEARLSAWSAHFRRQGMTPAVAPCRAGLRDCQILPNGDVRMCWEYPPIGNVRESSAREIWFGATARAQREMMIRCANFGSTKCASSCLSHRTIGQEWRRLMVLNRPAR